MKFLGVFIAIFFFTQSFTQKVKYADSAFVSPKAKISDIAWIEGSWKGDVFGLAVEEVWTKSSARSMMSVAKLYDEKGVSFYEISTISEENETLILRIRHFSSELIAWEPKDEPIEFQLISIDKAIVYFDGYTFELVNDTSLLLHIFIEEEENKETTIHYSRN